MASEVHEDNPFVTGMRQREPPISERPTKAVFAWSLMREHTASYILGTVLLAATLWMTFAIPRYVADAIDVLAAQDSFDADTFEAYVWLILAFATITVVVRTGSRLAFFVPGRRVEYDLKNRMLTHLCRLQRDYYLANPSGAIISRVNNDINGVRMLLGAGLMRALLSIGTLSLAPIYMYQISPRLTLYCTVPLVIGFIIVQSGIRAMRRLQVQQMQELRSLSEFTVESLNGIDVLKAYRAFDWSEASFHSWSEKVRDTSIRMSILRAYYMPLLMHLTNALKVALLIVGGTMVISEDMSPGDFTAYMLYLSLLVAPLVGMTFMLFILQRGFTSLGALMDVLFADPGVKRIESSGVSMPNDEPALRVDHLSFSYPDDVETRVLDDISFTVQSGEVVGIFGAVGAGKSTLLDLINGYLSVPQGTVFVNGEDVLALGHNKLREQLVTVSQEPFLFSDTIRNNIALQVDPEDERLEPAARAAALATDLARMPSGLQTMVGEKGITLSGGQKQRVSLARALVEPRRLLLLDDVLSAVDHSTERQLIEAIYRDADKRATLLVSHRLSVLAQAHRVLVIESGQIKDVGHHDELIERQGPYRDAWLLQRADEAAAPDSSA